MPCGKSFPFEEGRFIVVSRIRWIRDTSEPFLISNISSICSSDKSVQWLEIGSRQRRSLSFCKMLISMSKMLISMSKTSLLNPTVPHYTWLTILPTLLLRRKSSIQQRRSSRISLHPTTLETFDYNRHTPMMPLDCNIASVQDGMGGEPKVRFKRHLPACRPEPHSPY